MEKAEVKEKNPRLKQAARANMITVVEDSEVDKVVNTILDTTSTGSAGDGKIFISAVSEAIDIGTKKRGETAVV